VCRCAILVLPEGQCPHPRRSYGRRSGLHDSPDHNSISEHIEVIAGFVTSAVKRGGNLIKITDVTGHKSLEMLKTYSRDAEAFVGHAGAGLL
jgi:hypothetical protein